MAGDPLNKFNSTQNPNLDQECVPTTFSDFTHTQET